MERLRRTENMPSTVLVLNYIFKKLKVPSTVDWAVDILRADI